MGFTSVFNLRHRQDAERRLREADEMAQQFKNNGCSSRGPSFNS